MSEFGNRRQGMLRRLISTVILLWIGGAILAGSNVRRRPKTRQRRASADALASAHEKKTHTPRLAHRSGSHAAALPRLGRDEFHLAPNIEPQPNEIAEQKKSAPRFLYVLMILGALLLLVVVGDLFLRGFRREASPPVWETSGRVTDPGRQAITKYGCGGCHVIPGIRHATGRVGPKLEGFRDQMFIAGVLANVPENLAAWIQDPQQFNPKTAMPKLGVTETEARAIVTYIYAQP
jgi:cytochrome c